MSSNDTEKPVKILTVGSAVGCIKDLFAKIKSIDAKHGKFDLVLCTGDFFGPPKEDDMDTAEDEVTQLLNGMIEAPLRCYVMQGEHPLPESIIEQFVKTGGELAKDVFLFNKSGIITTAAGLRIACLGGVYEPATFSSSDAAPGFTSPHFTSQTIDRFLSNTLTKSTTTKKAQTKNYTSLAAIRDSASPSQLIDVLISNTWPTSIALASAVPIPPTLANSLSGISAPALDDIVKKTRPRYHFVASGGSGERVPPSFWEREPYIWADEENKRTSRFVSLGAFGGTPSEGKKQRWFYAFSIAPNSTTAAPAARPANATKNPFTEVVPRPPKRDAPDSGENYIWGDVGHPIKRNRSEAGGPAVPGGKPPPGYKCRRCDSVDSQHFISDCPDRSKPPDGYICKICSVPGHLVRDCPTRDAVGDTGGRKPKEGYLCRGCGSDAHYLEDCPVANQRGAQYSGERGGGKRRGPPKEITSDECWFCLSNPNLAKHLIVSIGAECYVTLPKGQIIPTHSGQSAPIPGGGHVLIVPISHHPTLSTIPPDLAPSILGEVEALKTALRSLYAKYGHAPVFYEVARLSAKGGHAHVQVVPVPNKIADLVESAFIDQGRQLNIDFEADAEEALESCQGGRQGYFRVDLPNGKKMVHVLKDHVPFSIQFGRQVIVDVLGMQERFDWKACMLSEEDDRADALAFKTAFAPFDPTL